MMINNHYLKFRSSDELDHDVKVLVGEANKCVNKLSLDYLGSPGRARICPCLATGLGNISMQSAASRKRVKPYTRECWTGIYSRSRQYISYLEVCCNLSR